MTEFDAFMRNLPFLVLTLGIGSALSWLVIRGAVLSALRKHSSEQNEARED
ncbi:MAG: hypothetical protein LBE05_05820 [Microbacterium sp.]|nr:hypothetical protein [Microbacterium sp.]